MLLVGRCSRCMSRVIVDAIDVTVRDGHVGHQPFSAAIELDLTGRRDVLGLWAGTSGGESATFWLSVLTDRRNRGVRDVVLVVCDGLTGLPDSVATAFPTTIVQTCVIHVIRGSFRYASTKPWEALATDMRAISTAFSATAAWAAFEELEQTWGKPDPAIPTLWHQAWEAFIPFLDDDVEIRTVLCSTNAIESLNTRFRRAVNTTGHVPTQQTTEKTLHLLVRFLDPNEPGTTTIGDQMQAHAQHLHHHLHRPHANSRDPLVTTNTCYTEKLADPRSTRSRCWPQ